MDSAAKLNIEIRPIKAIEHQQLIDLWLECGLTRSWNNPEKDIQRKLSFQPDLLLGAFQKEQLVGSIMAGYDGHRGWMNYLGVLPNFQRQGIGKKLVEVAENGLQKLGCPKVNLQLRYSNFVAQHFYRKIGYREDAALSFGKRLVFDSAESKPHGGSGTGGFVIRNKLKPGDLGGLIQLYGLIIHQKLGAAEPFEYEFAKILTNFALGKEPREKIWVLEQEGQIRGSILVVWSSEEIAEIKYFFLHYDQRGREFEYQLLRGALEFAKSFGGKSIITTPKLLGIGEVNIFDEFGFKKLEKSKVSPAKSHEMHSQIILNLGS